MKSLRLQEMHISKQLLAENVWLLSNTRYAINAYLVDDVLVDSRTKYAYQDILDQVAGHSVSSHVLTHAHIDHMGSSHELCQTLFVPLLCGVKDKDNAESGGQTGLQDKPWPVKLEHKFLAGPGHKVSWTLKQGDKVGSFVVIETPGHSPGHISLWREEDRFLIAGDVLFNVGKLRLAPNMLTPNPAQNLASARKLAALKPSTICFGHGKPMFNGHKFQKTIQQLF